MCAKFDGIKAFNSFFSEQCSLLGQTVTTVIVQEQATEVFTPFSIKSLTTWKHC